ncbi:MAG: MBL fold metallo-hydrolase [Firmicutes bacterium]|nr:MBL fold metallo-hydrolase [Bacillota bacterium]
MKITFLIDNKTESTECDAEWGLSVLIETEDKTILMDQGASPMLVNNARRMGLDLNKVDLATASHGHNDHTGGTEYFFEVNDHAPIYVHKEGFSYQVVDDIDGNIGIPWSEEFMEENAERIIRTEGTYQIDDKTWLIGNVPSIEGFTPTEDFFIKVGDKFFPDQMRHEQTLVIEDEKGLHVFSGCSHKGIIPILRYIGQEIPGKKIDTLVAGMHLYCATDEFIDATIKEMKDLGIRKIFPVHCTGMNAILRFKMQMGDAVEIATAGDVYEI